MYVKNTLNPIEIRPSPNCTREIIQVNINPKNAVHLKLVLIYRNTKITAADDDEFNIMLNEIYYHNMNVIMGDFNLPIIDRTLQRPTPAPDNKLMQLLADNNLTQHVHETTRQNNLLDLVISMKEELIVNLKIANKIGYHQAVTFTTKAEKGNTASEKKLQL